MVPGEIAITSEIPPTVTGTRLFPELLFPSCLEPLLPQHCAEPFERTAQVCESPAAIEVASEIPLTVTGIVLSVVLLFPS